MLTLSAFRDGFPDFVGVADAMVNAKLADAWAQIDTGVWEDLADQAHGQLTAHLLSVAPGGQQARLEPSEGGFKSTTYGATYWQMLEGRTCAIRVF